MSFQLVLRELRGQGIPDLTAADAGFYIDKHFNPEIGSGGYFADYYESRIKALHPSSRFGTFAFTPLQADDYFSLRHSLVEIDGFLITGRVWESS